MHPRRKSPRIEPFESFGKPFIITNEEMAFIIEIIIASGGKEKKD